MRVLPCLSLTGVLIVVAGTSRGADNVPPDGFVALFNGKDLTGWKGLVADRNWAAPLWYISLL
jgi:hypothetical protein